MELTQALLDVLAPRDCVDCGGVLDRALSRKQLVLCCACALRVPATLRPLAVTSPLAWACGLGPYDGPLGALVRRGKYRPDVHVFDVLGHRLGVAASGRVPSFDVVVPVPVPPRRRLSRGFDQAVVLGAPVARALDLPLVRLLQRVRAAEQAAHHGKARVSNARGAFRYRRGEAVPDRVLLIDDVCTTGATAAACADELLSAGARRVGLLVVAAAQL